MIKIAHLYYDLLNLYGESGNIKALLNVFESQNVNAEVIFLTINDEFKFDDYDLIYIGCGTDNNQELVIKDLLKHKKNIKNYIESGKFLIATGNSIELFGKYIETDNKKIEALNIFEFYSKRTKKRLVSETFATCELIDSKIIGFQNQGSAMYEFKNHLFKVESGIGSGSNDLEGYHEFNFYGTYLIGPLLVRNPNLLEYLVKKIILSKYENFEFRDFELDLERKAYIRYLEKYEQRKKLVTVS